jgi:hypothetical protein
MGTDVVISAELAGLIAYQQHFNAKRWQRLDDIVTGVGDLGSMGYIHPGFAKQMLTLGGEIRGRHARLDGNWSES